MKKQNYLFTLGALCICFLFQSDPILVHAETAETITATETESTETEDGVGFSPYDGHAYGELQDGLFARDMAEEMEGIPRKSDDYFKEYYEMIEAHRLGYLTPEMEAAGYFLASDGLVYTKEESTGDAPEGDNVIKITGDKVADGVEVEKFDENGNPVVDYGNGYVSFTSIVHPDIHEVCFVEITSYTSNQIYSFELYEQNGYSKSIQLPAGNYVVSGGGIREDFTSKYPINNPVFTVTEGASTVVEITIGHIDEEAVKNGVVIELEETAQTTQTPEAVEPTEEVETKSKLPIKTIIFDGIIIIIVSIFIYRKFHK